MKKILTWVFVVSLIASFIDWGIVGLKIMNGEYDFTPLVYVAVALWAVMFGCLIFFRFSKRKCPYCGKAIWTNGKYCSYCGKEITNKD